MESSLITEFVKLRRRRENFFWIQNFNYADFTHCQGRKILNVNKFGFNFRPFILTFYLLSTTIDGKTAQFHKKTAQKTSRIDEKQC